MKAFDSQNTVIRKEVRRDGEENNYSYELLMRRGDSVANFRMPLYSIKVYMTGSDGTERKASAKDAFSDEEKALVFFEKIVRNLATPIDLAYIIEDEAVN